MQFKNTNIFEYEKNFLTDDAVLRVSVFIHLFFIMAALLTCDIVFLKTPILGGHLQLNGTTSKKYHP